MKIAFLRSDFWFNLSVGGSVSHIAGFNQGVKENGHSIFYISSDKLSNIKDKIYVIKPGVLKFFPWFGVGSILYNLFFIIKSFSILRREKPDFIYERYRLYGISGVILKKKLKIPIILEVNGSEVWVAEHWGKIYFKKIATCFEQFAFKNADLITCVSNPLKKQLLQLGVSASKIIVNPNGVNPRIFDNKISGEAIKKKYQLSNKIIVGFIGTFGLWHGVEILASSIKEIIKENNNIHFLLIGDGALKPKIETIIQKDNIQDNITLTGIIPHQDTPQYLAACDILVSPTLPNSDGSDFFGSPTKLFEYMAMGKGIIASEVGQIKEILEHNKTALLIKPNSINELSAAIIKLTNNSDLRKTLGLNARQTVMKEYTWNENAKRVIVAYSNLITLRK